MSPAPGAYTLNRLREITNAQRSIVRAPPNRDGGAAFLGKKWRHQNFGTIIS
jgi:hypothetical protein